MNLHLPIIVAGAICTALLGIAALIYRPRTLTQWSFLVAVALLTVESAYQWLSLRAVSLGEMLFWQRAAILPTASLPLTWLIFSLTFGRGDPIGYLRRSIPALILLGVLPLGLAFAQWQESVLEAHWFAGGGHWRFDISPPGKWVRIAMVLSSILVLTNLETTFRAAVGTARWKVKYAVFGLALWAGARIYTGSQIILYSTNTANLIVINSTACVVASVFFGIALYRSKLSKLDIYPSPAALHRSITFIIAGVYLLVIGLLAKAVSSFGGGEDFPLAALIILLGLSGLAIFTLSDRVRNATRLFVARHFQRPAYDYRQVWASFTQKTVAVLDRQEYCRQAVGVVSETFESLSVTIWLSDPGNKQFVFAGSTALEARQAAPIRLSDGAYQDIVSRAATLSTAVDLDQTREKCWLLLKESNPSVFPKAGGHRFCLPLVFGKELAGLLVLGDRVRGIPFSNEDLELLKCLGDQMAAGLRTLSLSEKLVRAKELEAFQLMSAFLVHDLKNTGSALSLTLKNLPAHFANAAFREDALRTLSRSVQRVNELIARLTTLRQKLEVQFRPTDLNQVVAAALRAAGEQTAVAVTQNLQPLPAIPLDANLMESVITNLLLNAREAITGQGQIHVETGRHDDHATLTVRDNGCGMSAEFLAQSLFKPFKTSKKTGLGIGMYQTKMIVDAHGGHIIVNSDPGQGTTFRVLLPLGKVV